MKAYRIAWYSILDETTVFEARSLIYSNDQQSAAQKIFHKKAFEYHLRPHKIIVESIIEMTYLNKA